MWIVKPFNQLNTQELFLIYQARTTVFVVEQNCPYQEVDDDDLSAIHVFDLRDGQIAAYCRLIPTDSQVKLGRVLVSKDFRKDGLGRDLVQKALQVAKQTGFQLPVYAQAQAYLEKFYASFGFKATSEVYLEDDIPHLDMILTA
ncbi:GNAT family N-acetyltransferase [Streptococcus sp. HF-1907]|uniref:GNAT family N-acetyltransferase n=1 Tax=Streptococcus sp. HF-1907 TaxID=2785793 RepID=UPI0018A03C8E|nr:GNAT family N-acetyltransferase [Streptococcus sp. HF-1907]MBF7094789.1 GNAT family N-acetyltransferase [Streptococcus sp. HF-1907]